MSTGIEVTSKGMCGSRVAGLALSEDRTLLIPQYYATVVEGRLWSEPARAMSSGHGGRPGFWSHLFKFPWPVAYHLLPSREEYATLFDCTADAIAAAAQVWRRFFSCERVFACPPGFLVECLLSAVDTPLVSERDRRMALVEVLIMNLPLDMVLRGLLHSSSSSRSEDLYEPLADGETVAVVAQRPSVDLLSACNWFLGAHADVWGHPRIVGNIAKLNLQGCLESTTEEQLWDPVSNSVPSVRLHEGLTELATHGVPASILRLDRFF
jgi:hypothetical protein